MKKDNMKYWLNFLIALALVSSVFSQTSIEQKLSVFFNSGVIGGNFVIKYEIKGSSISSSNTLGSLNADIIYDSNLVRFTDVSDWNNNISSAYGYEKYIGSNAETDSKRSVRVMINGLNVNGDSTGAQPVFNVTNTYTQILKLNFIILDNSSPASFTIKTSTNQVGIFTNPGNNPNTFEINDENLSNPIIIQDEPLPVMLASFNSSVESNSVSLKWSTSSEQNNRGFKIERKQSNSSWTEAGSVNGKGNATSITNYNFEDKNLPSGKYDYRLKQIDNNGNFKYYNLNKTIEVGIPVKYYLSQNYPNPFNPTTKINYELPGDSKVNLCVYDILGREVMSLVNQEQKAGYYTVLTDAKNLASGTYFYRLTAKSNGKDFVMSKKMSVIK